MIQKKERKNILNYDDIREILEPILIVLKLTDNIESKFVSFDKYGLILYIAKYDSEYWKELFLFEFKNDELYIKDFVTDAKYTFNKEQLKDYFTDFIQKYKIVLPAI
jgi:hypothetical protein